MSFWNGSTDKQTVTDVVEVISMDVIYEGKQDKYISIDPQGNILQGLSTKEEGLIRMDDFSNDNKWEVETVENLYKRSGLHTKRYVIDKDTWRISYRELMEEISLTTGDGSCKVISRNKSKFPGPKSYICNEPIYD